MPGRRAKLEISAGGVVVRIGDGGPRVLLIRDGHRNWGFPKGHLVTGETPEDAARREVGEETGLGALDLHEALGQIDWHFRHRGRLIHKHCHFFLFTSAAGNPVPQAEEGITECVWLSLADAETRLTHANARRVLQTAVALIDEGVLDGARERG